MSDEQPENSLVMPFVSVTSKGGPYDDQAYVAGWQMGALDLRLETLLPSPHIEMVRADDLPQADLIAMAHGYSMTAEATEADEWMRVVFVRQVTTT